MAYKIQSARETGQMPWGKLLDASPAFDSEQLIAQVKAAEDVAAARGLVFRAAPDIARMSRSRLGLLYPRLKEILPTLNLNDLKAAVKEARQEQERDRQARNRGERHRRLAGRQAHGADFFISGKGGVRFVPAWLGSYLLEDDDYMTLGGALRRYQEGVYFDDGGRLPRQVQRLLGDLWAAQHYQQTRLWFDQHTYARPEDIVPPVWRMRFSTAKCGTA